MFSCTPGQLVTLLVGKLAVSDGLSLNDIWHHASSKTNNNNLDGLQKNVIWQALVNTPGSLFSASVNGEPIHISPNLTLDNLLLHGSEHEIFLTATQECQCTYLTSSEHHQSIKSSLGELPFQLLIVIARHGADGILNADLARESGQDIRSLRVRLQKLELAGFITTKSVYVDKKHTTHAVHTKFAAPLDESFTVSAGGDDESLDSSRDVAKVKRHIVDALKAAPNQLRGFSDLRKELNLDSSVSANKFFRSICLKLHRQGYVEKLTVELPESTQRLYAIKFLKDIPKDAEELTQDMDILNDNDDDDEDIPLEQPSPLLNRVFPVFNQIFYQIHKNKERGSTSGEVAKALLGNSDYRPYTRLFEVLPSYLSNGKTLKSCKKTPDPYDKYTVSKLYDNEGKVKFYRYTAAEFCKEDKSASKAKPAAKKTSQASLETLNRQLYVPIGSLSNDSLRAKKSRLFTEMVSAKPLKKAKREEDSDLAEVADLDEPRKKRKTKRVSYTIDENLMDVDAGNDDFVPEPETKEEEHEKPEAKSKGLLSSSSLPQFVPVSKEKKNRSLQSTKNNQGSAKSMARRSLIIDIIREEGGATYSSLSLCRKLDERMGNSTVTDVKTLARDVVHLNKLGALDIQKVPVEIGGLTVEKKLLVLTKDEDKPSAAKLQELRDLYAQQRSKKNMKMFQKRLILSDVKLYVEAPRAKKPLPKKRRKGKNRLQALGDDDMDTSSVKQEPSEGPSEDAQQDVFSQIKKSKRAKKAVQASGSQGSLVAGKRARRNIKLERSGATLLFRAVVISKAFSRDAIDFDKIAENFPGLDGKLAKQKWGTLRRLFGGAGAVSQGVESFQNMVMQGIEDGSITEKELISGDIRFFLDYWRDFDTGIEFDVEETMPLYSTRQRNEAEYQFVKLQPSESVTYLADKIEDISMRQKEAVLGQVIFGAEQQQMPSPKKHERLRQTLKSMFSAKEDSSDPLLVKKILERYGEQTVKEATDALMKDKELFFVYMENNGETKFVLSDRFNSTLMSRVFTPKFFHQAAIFKETLLSLSKAKKGLVLSQGVMPGEMACLLELVSRQKADILRIDREFKFENYESRLIDKELIACDLVVSCSDPSVETLKPTVSPIPFEGPCYPIWIDASAEVNKSLWTKILINLLYYIVFKPGITEKTLFEKLNPVLGVEEFGKITQWLVDSGCVEKYDLGGFRATDRWQYILGY